MQVRHVALLDPFTPRGQQSAQVESDPAKEEEFQESMIFYERPQTKIIVVEEGLGCKTSF
jgi:hypothetical protein